MPVSFWSHPPAEAELVGLLYRYGYVWLCPLNKLDAILFQGGWIIHFNSQLNKNSTLIPDSKYAKAKWTTCHFWFRWIHIYSILRRHQYSGGIPWGTDSYRFLYILNCFAALSNVSTLIVHRETFHFLHHKTRKSSEISLSRLRSNFRPISADISLKLVQTWQLTGPFPPARHLRINEVWHHG